MVQIPTGKVLQSHTPHGPSGVEFSRDGRELVAPGCCWTGSGSTLVAWDACTGRQLFSLGAGIDAAAFDLAPDPRRLGVGTGGGKFLLLAARSGKQTAPPIQAAAGDVAQVSFSADDRSFAVSGS